MPLRSEFAIPVSIQLGHNVPSLGEQCAAQGLLLHDPDLWEDRHRAWALLRVGGFLTDTEAARIGQRLITGVSQAVGFEQAIQVVKEILTQSSGDASGPVPAEPVLDKDRLLGAVNRWVEADGPQVQFNSEAA